MKVSVQFQRKVRGEEEFSRTLAAAYRSAMGRELRTLVSGIGGGATAWTLA